MFSYRHAFHAGNHADVLKHAVLVQLLQHLNQKAKPYLVLDTHAGAGQYALDSAFAQKNAEFDSGITRLWSQNPPSIVPRMLADYLALIGAHNPAPNLQKYPGSPQIARWLQRPGDQLRLYELHPSEIAILRKNMSLINYSRDSKTGGPRIFIEHSDGFAALKAVLPPTQRRGLILIDPPYEDKQDYLRVIQAVRAGLQRFSTGTYAVWYPQVQRNESRRFPEQLMKLPGKNWLHVALTVKQPAADGLGLHGSGLHIINPPWTLAAQLKEAMPYLVKTLGQDTGACFDLQYQED